MKFVFWVLYIVGLLLWVWGGYVAGQPYDLRRTGGGFILIVLIGILGYTVFNGLPG